MTWKFGRGRPPSEPRLNTDDTDRYSLMEAENRVQWVYSAQDNRQLAERYDQWATEYDSDIDRDFGWLGPERAAEVFAKYVPKNARVLDAGAGTGLVGQALSGMGFRDIVAMDLSMGMLDEARTKNVYRSFHQMALGEKLDFDTNAFDAVISVGVFTLGHAPSSGFDELARITKPGGHIVFSLRTDVYQDGGFKEKQAAMESAGTWKLAQVTDPFQPLPKGEPEVLHQIWAYQVT